MNQSASVIITECPRDAMQGWPHFIPTDQKLVYLSKLLEAGFDIIDCGSFVSPKAIPQMADTRQVLDALDMSGTTSKLLTIIANLRGAEEAVSYDKVSLLGFPFSISPTFQQRNANSTMEESVERVDAIQELCIRHNKTLVVYLSMGFGNPYGDVYNEEILLHWVDQMAAKQISVISLADTVGLATPEQIHTALSTVVPRYPSVSFGAHLHSTPANWQEKLDAAFMAGCRRFDGALKGIGGCPMAQDELVGNMATEQMIGYFESRGLALPVNKEVLAESLRMAGTLFINH